ncbi:minichromosome maintenance- protein [Apophysomyces ossiformis]|uniref:Minichromosome maintenance- protein n=1 Tax=Apophysomyces ossiformis TaxID=679940 RepID=A0A8H7EPA3_9FUNG|nr:minichromosome maintenance- protein [Apophysomyces ossiformis]
MNDTSSTVNKPAIENIEKDLSNWFRLRNRKTSVKDLERFVQAETKYVRVHNLPEHVKKYSSIYVGSKPSDDWVTIGIVDRIVCRSDFWVARLTNMRGAFFYTFAFGRAYKDYGHVLHPGSVLAVYKPTILLSKQSDAAVGLHVNYLQQLKIIGDSRDLVRCEAYINEETQCDEMVDGREGEYCDRHIATAYKSSRFQRTELTSGNSAVEVRWAQVRQTEKGVRYEEAAHTKKQRRDYTYTIHGKGIYSSDGRHLSAKREATKPTEQDKVNLSKFLQGRTDHGAEMLRKINGIEEAAPKSALSLEAMSKMGLSSKHILTDKEEDAKKRAIAALLNSNAKEERETPKGKKPRYVYL